MTYEKLSQSSSEPVSGCSEGISGSWTLKRGFLPERMRWDRLCTELDDFGKLVNHELLVLWRMGSIESPLLNRDISADKICKSPINQGYKGF